MLVNSKQPLITANKNGPDRSAVQHLSEYEQETGYTDFNFELRLLHREEVRPITHLKNRPPMLQKSLAVDELDSKSSKSEDYDV